MDTKLNSVSLIRFYREDDGSWYADVHGHTKGENKMVAGSDKFLQAILDWNHESDGYDFGEILMTVSTEKPDKNNYLFELKRVFHDRFGATYLIKGNSESNIHFWGKKPKLCWLCNVVHTVLGEHPKRIYIMNCS